MEVPVSADLITGLSAKSRRSFGLSTNTQTIEPSSASRILNTLKPSQASGIPPVAGERASTHV